MLFCKICFLCFKFSNCSGSSIAFDAAEISFPADDAKEIVDEVGDPLLLEAIIEEDEPSCMPSSLSFESLLIPSPTATEPSSVALFEHQATRERKTDTRHSRPCFLRVISAKALDGVELVVVETATEVVVREGGITTFAGEKFSLLGSKVADMA